MHNAYEYYASYDDYDKNTIIHNANIICDMHYFTLLFLVKHAANLYSLMHMRLYCKHLT